MRTARVLPAALAATLGALGVLVAVPGSAAAETRGDWATWSSALGGGAGAYTTRVTLPGAGGPTAQVTSTSGGGAALVSGESTWLGETTGPGTAYGSSRDRRYLNLRPAANDAPSVTTYDFDDPTPAGWGLVLGDIDADRAVVTGRLPGGAPATGVQLGLQGTFNYCDVPSPRPCSGAAPFDQPTATTDSGSVAVVGNPGAADTTGAAAWLRPTVPLDRVVVTYHQRNGSPTYQTWLGGTTRDVSGTLTAPDACDPTTARVVLLDTDDDVLAATRPAADGTWSFDRVSARADLSVRLAERPDGCVLVPGATQRPAVDLSAADATGVDLAVQEASVALVDVVGRARAGTDPVAGVELTLADAADEMVAEATSDATGAFVLDDVEPGSYTFTVTPPDGYRVVGEEQRPLTVQPGGDPVQVALARTGSTPTDPDPSPTDPDPVDAQPGAPGGPGAAAGPAVPVRTVVTTTPTTTGTPVTTLPATGGPAAALPWLGLVLLLGGGALVATSRRTAQGASR